MRQNVKPVLLSGSKLKQLAWLALLFHLMLPGLVSLVALVVFLASRKPLYVFGLVFVLVSAALFRLRIRQHQSPPPPFPDPYVDYGWRNDYDRGFYVDLEASLAWALEQRRAAFRQSLKAGSNQKGLELGQVIEGTWRVIDDEKEE